MKKNDKLLLEEILETAQRIEKFCRGITEQKFYKNELVQSAVIRQFEILGEAINHLSSDFREKHSKVEWSQAVSFRNILIHGYRDVDVSAVWKTIKKDLPKLEEKIEEILESGMNL